MGVVAELGRLAIGAWSPGGSGGGFIAAGTYASPTDTVDTAASLEILSLDISRSKLTPVTELPIPAKVCVVDWGMPFGKNRAGLLAAGLTDGTVRIWDAASVLGARRGSADDSTGVLFGGSSAKKHHSVSVRGLAFNPFLPTRLATGAADGEVLIWDLSNPSAGPTVRPPAGARQTSSNATGPKEEVTAVAWNRKLQHILGSANNSGVLSVWDLRQSKQVISVRNPRGRLRCSSLAWHPEVPTQIIVSCEEDESTAALMWDLRNASAPVMSFGHHSAAGIISTSWCPHDSDLLLTSSRDLRTAVVSVSSGEVVSEAPQSANWNFDVKWSSRIPGLYLASSVDGNITVNSMMTTTTAPSVSSETANALAESFGEAADGFQSSAAPASPRAVEAQRVTYNAQRPPKWMKKPVSVSFGFGGRKVSVSAKSGTNVRVDHFSEIFHGLKETTVEVDDLLEGLTIENLPRALRWCQEASAAAEMPRDKMAWDALGIAFQTDCRRKLLKYLGFGLPPMEAGDDIAMPVYGLSQSQPLAIPVRPLSQTARATHENKSHNDGDAGVAANGLASMDLDGPAPWEVSDPTGSTVNAKESILDGDDTANDSVDESQKSANGVSAGETDDTRKQPFAGKSREEIDAVVKRSMVVGDFRTAVKACLHVGRNADALIIAHAGGPDLWLNTQAEYMSSAGLSDGFSIVSAVAGPKSKMDAYISEAAKTGKNSWKEALAVILTYSAAEDVSVSCTSLGERLLLADKHAEALFCFICAGNTRMATTVWMRDRPPFARASSAMMGDRIERLGVLVEKIRVLTAASALASGQSDLGTVRAFDEVSGSVLCEYGALLAIQGDFASAMRYLRSLDPNCNCVYGSAEELLAQASEDSAGSENRGAAGGQETNRLASGGYNPYSSTFHEYNYDSNPSYTAPAAPYTAPSPQGVGWGASLPPPAPAGPAPTSYGMSPPAPDLQYSAPAPSASAPSTTLPRPQGVYGSQASTASRTIYDPSAAYESAPTYGQDQYQVVPPPPAPASNLSVAGSSLSHYPAAMPAAPPMPSHVAPMPVAPSASNLGASGGIYGGPGDGMGASLGMQSHSLAPPPPPPPPPPADNTVPPPMSYHTRAKPGSGASLPPSAEVAVAETRRAKPMSSSGTPSGPMRSNSTSSLNVLGVETVFLEKADVSKLPADQQVIAKSLRGSYLYALTLNQTPLYKKKMEEVSKRLGRLLAGLNAGVVDAAIVELLVQIGKAIEQGNYSDASGVVSVLTKRHWDSNSQWIQGLKRLIDAALTGR